MIPAASAATVKHDPQIPRLVFVAQELYRAFAETDRDDLHVTLMISPNDESLEAIRIESPGLT